MKKQGFLKIKSDGTANGTHVTVDDKEIAACSLVLSVSTDSPLVKATIVAYVSHVDIEMDNRTIIETKE